MLDFLALPDPAWLQTTFLILDYAIKIIAVGTVPEGRKPAASSAWLLAILVIPLVGLPLFLLMGSPYINRRRHRIQQEADTHIRDVQREAPDFPDHWTLTPELESIIKLNRRLTRLPAVTGHSKGFYTNYHEAIAAMTAAVDRAEHSVHVEIYIVSWDTTTEPFFRALERAVQRGVKVRLLFDHVGSWKYPGYWTLGRKLTRIGVEWHVMLPLQPWKWRFRRPDLRNHRKMLLIDGHTGFIGSQNLIDSSYLLRGNRRRGLNWVDLMVELTGPVVSSMEMIFATDWFAETNEALTTEDIMAGPPVPLNRGSSTNVLQLVPSGPGYTTEPNLRLFNSLAHHAKERLVLCSPYFIPDETLLESVTTACYRGVRVELYVNESSDQFIVSHAQSSYYRALLEAGVHIYRYPAPAILHSKYMLADPDTDNAVGVLGSSNMDMRSFGLNYEVSLLVAHGDLIEQLAELTTRYQERSTQLTLEQWSKRNIVLRYIDNVMRLTSGLQ
ncbi:cardiolipin synthase [Corynebacterium epidermidicanis]|uniref:Cardiolipin synthase n=1 Tax=Corynebacterium epidermidicanis TaxID=1050174 RepID=A0A0G3GSB0_9CORY|nr:cardiolipin synthase [Corynebacterium epidermidicanis]AKK04024.1 cardiolipin synthase [Corynebacterium epidermidicanis]